MDAGDDTTATEGLCITARDHDPAPTEVLLTMRDVAGQCRVSERTVQRWIATGELPVLRPGRSIRLRRADLVAFLKRARQTQKHKRR